MWEVMMANLMNIPGSLERGQKDCDMVPNLLHNISMQIIII